MTTNFTRDFTVIIAQLEINHVIQKPTGKR